MKAKGWTCGSVSFILPWKGAGGAVTVEELETVAKQSKRKSKAKRAKGRAAAGGKEGKERRYTFSSKVPTWYALEFDMAEWTNERGLQRESVRECEREWVKREQREEKEQENEKKKKREGTRTNKGVGMKEERMQQ